MFVQHAQGSLSYVLYLLENNVHVTFIVCKVPHMLIRSHFQVRARRKRKLRFLQTQPAAFKKSFTHLDFPITDQKWVHKDTYLQRRMTYRIWFGCQWVQPNMFCFVVFPK